jgi:hypothetical protein
MLREKQGNLNTLWVAPVQIEGIQSGSESQKNPSDHDDPQIIAEVM